MSKDFSSNVGTGLQLRKGRKQIGLSLHFGGKCPDHCATWGLDSWGKPRQSLWTFPHL